MVYTWTSRVLFACALTGMIVATGCNSTGQSDRTQTKMSNRVDNQVRLEHVGLNVANPIKTAQWYVDNLGMRIAREGPPPINARFLADSGDNMMLEVYHNPPDAVPDYASMDPLLLHVAFMADDVDAVRQRLMAAGATPVGEVTTTPAGDKLAMLRDPWGLAVQLVHRADPMLAGN